MNDNDIKDIINNEINEELRLLKEFNESLNLISNLELLDNKSNENGKILKDEKDIKDYMKLYEINEINKELKELEELENNDVSEFKTLVYLELENVKREYYESLNTSETYKYSNLYSNTDDLIDSKESEYSTSNKTLASYVRLNKITEYYLNSLIKNCDNNIKDELRKEFIKEASKNLLENEELTPWDFSINRNEKIEKIVGTSSIFITITIINGNNEYKHPLTQELAFGLLLILQPTNYKLYINDMNLHLDDLISRYSNILPKTYYSNILVNNIYYDIYFNNLEVLQGIITASEWLNIPSNKFILSIMGKYNNKMIPLKY